MAYIFTNNRFFPQNFYLSSENDRDFENQYALLCAEALQLSPESFNGEQLFFKFILHYCPPYEHDRFCELKRLQEVARSNTRFKDEYRGYIVIDISEWEGHFAEELFSDIVMSFLSDMSDFWKYLFVTPGYKLTENERRVLNRFFKVKNLDVLSFVEPDSYKSFFESLSKNYDIHFSALTESIFRRFIPQKVMRTKETVSAIGNDLKSFFGAHTNIRAKMMAAYLKNPDAICYNLISEKNMEIVQRINKEEITL